MGTGAGLNRALGSNGSGALLTVQALLTIRGNWLMRSFRAARPSADGAGTSTCDGARERRGAVTCFELEEERTVSILSQYM